MNARLEAVKQAAVTALDELFDENANDIMDAETRAKAEGERQGKTIKFKLGFRVTIDDANHEAKHELGWSFSFKRSRTSTMPDPDQPELGMEEDAQVVATHMTDPADVKPKRKRARKPKKEPAP